MKYWVVEATIREVPGVGPMAPETAGSRSREIG